MCENALKTGITVIVLGMVLMYGPVPLLSDYEAELPLKWNLQNARLVFEERVIDEFPSMDTFRSAYPSYSDLGDEELAGMLHRKYLEGIAPYEEFRAAFIGAGVRGESPGPDGPAGRFDPLSIRGRVEPVGSLDMATRSILEIDALDYGLFKRRTISSYVEYGELYALGACASVAGALVLLLAVTSRRGA